MRTGIFAALALLLLATPAAAYLCNGNQRLDHVFYPGHDEKAVLHVEVTAVDAPASEEMSMGPPDLHVGFDVRTVLRGDAALAGKALRFYVGNFLWPERLVPMTLGARALLILDDDASAIRALVPAHREEYEPVVNREAMIRLLASDLLAEALAAGDDRERARQLILTVGPILAAEEARPLGRFLASDDPWLRRAALAALVAATRDPERIAAAGKDIAAYLDANAGVTSIPAPDGTPGFNPYPLLFDHYFCLDLGWSREEDEAAGPFRPLFRTVVAHSASDVFPRWQYGVRPLCRAGDAEDLPLLDAEYKRRRGDPEKAHERQQILLGMARILGLDLPAWTSDSFPKFEAAQYAEVRTAMAEARRD